MTDTQTKLTHDEIRQACHAPSNAKELTCPCCGHDHLQLFSTDGVKCQNGCPTEKVIAECRRLLGTSATPHRSESAKSSDPPTGKLTLAEYGMAKHLSAFLLKQFGAKEGAHPYYKGVECAVCFPYYNERGEEVTQQWRWGMGKGKRKFLINKPTYLYGGHFLQLLEQMADNGKGRDDIYLVEGESNVHTLTQVGFPALGLPGVGNWKPEWSKLKCFQAAKRIYFFLDMQEDGKPETAAILGARKVAESFPSGKVLAVKLPVKDISDLWIQMQELQDLGGDDGGEEGFRRALADAILTARPVIPIREEVEGKPADLGEEVLNACPILKDFVALTLPHVETDINNIVCDFLACAGAAIGLRGYAMHVFDKHPPATYHLLIANTSVGKGTVWGCVNELFSLVVPDWKKCLRSSARSQQALYRALKEASDVTIAIDKKDGEELGTIPNPDYNGGRILLRFSEVSAVFKSMRAEWSTMSQALRETYDGRPVSNELGQKDKSTRVDNPYALALLGDVAPWELTEVIADVDFANGVANRFIWCVSHQTKTLPHATHTPDYHELAARLRQVIPDTPIGQVTYSEAGLEAWDKWAYTLPLDDEGKLGSACGRMRANGLRLAVLFAILDEQRLDQNGPVKIEVRHVQAAAAIMDRHRATVAWFLARPTAIPTNIPETVKDKLYRQIEKVRAAMVNGEITGNQLYKLFSNQPLAKRETIAQAAGLHATEETDPKGNKIKVWR